MSEDLRWICPACKGPLLRRSSLSCPACEREFHHDTAWQFTADPPTGFAPERERHLAELEAAGHFWFVGRRKLLDRVLHTTVAPGSATRAIDLGCGGGSFLPVLRRYADVVVGVDAYSRSLARAAAQDPQAVLVQCDVADVPFDSGQFDLCAALDVLEHVDPDALLRELARLTRRGGLLLLSVPAFKLLWSVVDERAGHRRRYNVRDLRAELERAGWRWLGHTHYQFALFPLLLASRVLARRSRIQLERRPPAWLNAILAAVNSAEVSVFPRARLPFGSSLVAWARNDVHDD